MRLKVLTQRNSWWVRTAVDVFQAPIGPVAVSRYRPAFFGREFVRALRQLGETPAHWSNGETELFAAFVSKLNHCEY